LRPLHRPKGFRPDEKNAVIRFIQAGHANGTFVTQGDMLNFVESKFRKG
jgi:hypothetical protein